MIEVTVAGLGIAPPSSVPLLLLKERDGERVLPVGIGPLEAQAIVMPLQGVQPPRPMTNRSSSRWAGTCAASRSPT
jgi:bifunctional DNase/RNase